MNMNLNAVFAPMWLPLALLACPVVGLAADVGLKLEPGVAIPLSKPQSDYFNTGVGQSAKLLIGLAPFLDIGPTASFTLLPAERENAESGVIWGYGAGLRLKRPYEAESLLGLSPWLDGDFLVISTGELQRVGVGVAAGAALPIGEARSFWVGPFARYQHVLSPERVGFDSADAKTLSIGLSLEATTGRKRKAEIQYVDRMSDSCPAVVACPAAVVCKEAVAYERVVVKPDKLELKEKIYFEWDKATLEPVSYLVLDDVAAVLRDNPNFRVRVDGHTDSSGPEAHNQTLSEERAQAVVDYLVKRGVEPSRLTSKGFSSSEPTNTNTTDAGREHNRRVDFVVNFIILDGAK